MRIAIDARMMGAETARGIGRYVHELLGAMLEVAPEHRYVVVSRTKEHSFVSHPSVETVVADVAWYGAGEQLRMVKVLRLTRADIVHVPHWNVPLLYRGPLVITVHDLLLRHEPTSAKASTRGLLVRSVKRVGYRLVLDHAVSTAKRILVPSQFVADDVRSFYPDAAKRLVLTGEGMPRVDAIGGTVMPFEQEPGVGYLLYVGSAYPHKGLADLLAAWQKLSAEYPRLILKLAGELDVFMQHLRHQVEQEQLPRVEFLGRVSDTELHELYRGAVAFVYPSHFEGFGLPPLEAIAAGCPVVSSDAGPLPDVLSTQGATFFRAGDVDAMLAAVREVVAEPYEARQHLPELARALSQRHAWKLVAERTLASYQAVLAERTSWQKHPRRKT